MNSHTKIKMICAKFRRRLITYFYNKDEYLVPNTKTDKSLPIWKESMDRQRELMKSIGKRPRFNGQEFDWHESDQIIEDLDYKYRNREVINLSEVERNMMFTKLIQQQYTNPFGRISGPSVKDVCKCQYCGTNYQNFVSNCKNCGGTTII